MDCERVKLPGGAVAIVCGRRRKKCQFCKQASVAFECDWKVPERKSGTCDAGMCRVCAKEVGPKKHLCPDHQKLWAQHPKNAARG